MDQLVRTQPYLRRFSELIAPLKVLFRKAILIASIFAQLISLTGCNRSKRVHILRTLLEIYTHKRNFYVSDRLQIKFFKGFHISVSPLMILAGKFTLVSREANKVSLRMLVYHKFLSRIMIKPSGWRHLILWILSRGYPWTPQSLKLCSHSRILRIWWACSRVPLSSYPNMITIIS